MTEGPDIPTKTGWWVQIRGQAYGPYTDAQMAGFVAEGRVRPATRVSTAKDGEWREAREFEALMASLRGNRSFAVQAPAPAPAAEKPATEAANIFVFAEIHSGAWNRFMAALEGLGLVVDMAPGLWLIRTRHSAGIVRNTLSQTLENGDRFVVVDATRDRLAWYNLGPEVDVHIRDVWNGKTPTAPSAR